MDGTELLNEIARRIKMRKSTRSITDSALAKELGVTQPTLGSYRGKKITARQVVNLMEKFAQAAEKRLVDETVVPLVEFLHLNPAQTNHGGGWQLFSTNDNSGQPHAYLSGLRRRLERAHGIYIFHDSRGQAIYAGKAERRALWFEMNSAFNRDRSKVQNIKRVRHPINSVPYRGPEEKRRQIMKESVALHDIASYMSAYQVPVQLISKFESLLVRSFANDLLNVRMEKF